MSAFWKVAIPNRKSRINFTNPINGRLWLKLLVPDINYGIKFIPNLTIPPESLGFSLSTNKYGLRGPDNIDAEAVILGTSFAMGMSVNEGQNWYEIALDAQRWLNAAMPVGPQNHINLLESLYRGPHHTLIYLYHPNLWSTAKVYTEAALCKRSIFQYLNWRTSRTSTFSLYPKWISKELIKILSGYSVYKKWGNKDFHFNSRYCWFDLNKNHTFAIEQMKKINTLFSSFNKVIVLRVLVKEQCLDSCESTPHIEALKVNYDNLWNFFTSHLNKNVKTYQLDSQEFNHNHFHPYDTHWNQSGNKLFAEYLAPVLIKEGLEHLLGSKFQ